MNDTPRPTGRSKALVIVIVVAIVGFLGIQLIRPTIEHPPVTAELQAPPEVKQILRNSCFNCHSNETNLAWFDQIAPGYWLVARDIKEARQHLNFSEIAKLPPAQQSAMLYEAINMIQLDAMPLKSYRLAHHGAIVTPEQLAVLKNFLHPPSADQAAEASDSTAADTQYNNWIHASNPITNVHLAPNGVEYIPDYRNWKIISTTNRFDNKTMRIIYGNDIAMKAIAENNIHPWPDGTAFAKGAWTQQVDTNGDTKTGAFIQVEFMIKDTSKYAATKGWGFGRWRGDDLKPYGKDEHFASECVGCHNPLRDNDYVYTLPLTGQQAEQQGGRP
jgi:Haem-binding domain/Cytochrome P460